MKLIFRLGWLLLLLPLLAACNSADTNPLVGNTAPDFNLPSTSGETVGLSEFSGQPVLLYFHMAVG